MADKAVPLSLFNEETLLRLSGEGGQQSAPETPSRELAPMLQSYVDLKKRFSSHILLFQVGDFYEIFFEDARMAADVLSIRLTSRDKTTPDPVPMCGVPVHALENYLPRLLSAGHSVAIVSQVEELQGRGQKGAIKRELTRIVTPGVRLEGDGLNDAEFNFCSAAIMLPEGGAVVAIDISTGHLRIEECDSVEKMSESLERMGVREILVPSTIEDRPVDGVAKWIKSLREFANRLQIKITKRAFTISSDSELFSKVPTDISKLSRSSLLSLSTLLNYAGEVACGRMPSIGSISVCHETSCSLVDATTCKNLELLETRHRGEKKNSLFSRIDFTCTSMGARKLREWLLFPDADLEEIVSRHEAVTEFIANTRSLVSLRNMLKEIRDLERCISRIVSGRGTPRDLAVLRDSIRPLPEVRSELQSFSSKMLTALLGEFECLTELFQLLVSSLVLEPPLKFNEGEIFQPGYSQNVDELREIRKNGHQKLLEIEQRERLRTGISSLKVKYNNIFGYSIEISRSNLTKVPPDYERRQTLANAERYVTAELRQFEADSLNAKERLLEIEKTLFLELRTKVLSYTGLVQKAGRVIAVVDVLASFAQMALTLNYVRPLMTEGRELIIDGGRHPVVEEVIGVQNFVANNTELNGEDRRFAILTGPNMGGKSTYLRQIGLIQLLAQIGSFVPARKATLGYVDRIFTRIGASDDLTQGDSTFMVEMKETATILRRATRRSLVLIDEIGRGTATLDGRAIAFAVARYLHERLRCRTVFATHFHELTTLRNRPGIFCLSVGVQESEDGICFSHRILEAVGDRSYGIEVARLAGIPGEVLEIAKRYFSSEHFQPDNPPEVQRVKNLSELKVEVSKIAPEHETALIEIQQLNIDQLSPLDALLLLSRVKKRLAN